jgi:hypothetical protein
MGVFVRETNLPPQLGSRAEAHMTINLENAKHIESTFRVYSRCQISSCHFQSFSLDVQVWTIMFRVSATLSLAVMLA